MKTVYIILSTIGVGGAEKRFTDNWYNIYKNLNLDIHLVMDLRTYKALLGQKGYKEKIQNNVNIHVLDYKDGRYRTYCNAIREFLRGREDNVVLHYPLAYVPILQSEFKHKLILSWVNTNMPPMSLKKIKALLGAWAGFLKADHIDVLNPNNLNKLSKFPGVKHKVSLTSGGTIVDISLYRPQKKNKTLVFLGRTEPEKQSLRFVKQIPELYRLLKEANHEGYSFLICGDGSEALEIEHLIKKENFKSIPLKFGYSSSPETILGDASVFFSLQRTSNYPSKALAEAMACGAFPILTDVGESELMVKGCPYFEFVPKDFSAQNLFEAVSKYMDLHKKDKVIDENSHYAKDLFSPEIQYKYFYDIYIEQGDNF